jgi:hypothetical protein
MPIESSVLSAYAWLSGTIPLAFLFSQFQVEAKIHVKPCATSAGIHGNYDYVQRGWWQSTISLIDAITFWVGKN